MAPRKGGPKRRGLPCRALLEGGLLSAGDLLDSALYMLWATGRRERFAEMRERRRARAQAVSCEVVPPGAQLGKESAGELLTRLNWGQERLRAELGEGPVRFGWLRKSWPRVLREGV